MRDRVYMHVPDKVSCAVGESHHVHPSQCLLADVLVPLLPPYSP